MKEPKPRRTWYRRRRTWAAAVVLLAVGYPASFGPLGYFAIRGWIAVPVVEAYIEPIDRLLYAAEDAPEVARSWINAYTKWWVELGQRHAASD